MKLNITLLISAILHTVAANTQPVLPEGLSDTITPGIVAIKFCKTLDSVPGDTVFHLLSPNVYVIRNYDYNSIAIKTKKGYNVFDACPGQSVLDCSIDTMNFNDKGHNELVIRWSNTSGRSGWVDGWNESSSGVYIWDLDQMQLLFSFQDTYEYNYWYNGVEYDSAGNFLTDSLGDIIMYDSLSGGESSCDNYEMDIEFKKITIRRSADCPYIDEETSEHVPVNDRTYVYEVTPVGLILRKQ